jgi:hypothetical protein
MPPTDPEPLTPIGALGEALFLVFDAIALAQKGLVKNPSKEEERDLNETLNKLELRRAEIQAKMNALIDGTRVAPGPTRAQVARISALTAEVGRRTNASVTASSAVALSSRVLALATEVASA